MTEKQYFSVIRKDKEGALLRDANSRHERRFTWEEIAVFFIKETPRLYYFNEENPFQDKIERMTDEMNKDLAEITVVFLKLRKKRDLSSMGLFGTIVEDFCKKYELSVFEFNKLFQRRFQQVFGQPTSFDGMLTIKGLDKED